jgi:hypothetical protein
MADLEQLNDDVDRHERDRDDRKPRQRDVVFEREHGSGVKENMRLWSTFAVYQRRFRVRLG